MRLTPFEDAELTRDAFLGGLVTLLQPREGYRAGIDPVLLAASIPARPGQSILDLGCGGGIGLVLLGKRVGGLRLSGLEIQPGYADLARRNLALNGLEGEIHDGDVAAVPPALKAQSFDHVLMNPPYFDRSQGLAAGAADRETALGGPTPLGDWIAAASRRLKPQGHLTLVQRAERLPELLAQIVRPLGSVELWPLLPHDGEAPRLILLRARKDGRAPFRFHAPKTLHLPDRSARNGYNYMPDIMAVMRQGAALPFPR